ncbi:MAG: ribonuclease HII [Peptostreptococcus sp.]|uniref:ribonuclease HII n=1 Tax=Peptostreptococcus sp. TaxID=1262 RepID=UPI002FC69885
MLKEYNIEETSKLKTKEIKKISDEISDNEYLEFVSIFRGDERKSVQSICDRLIKKLEKIRLEDERLERMNSYEDSAYNEGFIYVGGVDEAGRGPLAGPVVAAVVVFDKHTKISGVNDSKKLSEAKRNELYKEIIENAKDYGIGMADNKEIDKYNILNATYMAMRRAISNLKNAPDCLLNDAVRIPGVDVKQVSIIQGDAKSISIAAASILAKVTRDQMMYEYDELYPGYSFSSNKGYGTTDHYNGIRNQGITPIHRHSFLKNFEY